VQVPNDPNATVAVPAPAPVAAPIAPNWHTAITLFVIAGLSSLSAYSHGPSPTGFSHGAVLGYLTVMAMEWSVVGFIWFGIRLRGVTMRDLVGGSWPSWTGAFRDLGIAVVFQILAGIVLALAGHLLNADGGAVARRLLPHGRNEIIVYLLLCATAGLCEEIIFRGYLQKQFSAWTRSAAAGLVLQAIVFGAGHAYQGPRLMGVIAVYGCLFGLLALWRRSLRPGMIAHFLQDSLVVLLGRFH
jgi:uncharacterized protein